MKLIQCKQIRTLSLNMEKTKNQTTNNLEFIHLLYYPPTTKKGKFNGFTLTIVRDSSCVGMLELDKKRVQLQ